MEYKHTQKAPLHMLLFGTAFLPAGAVWLSRHEPAASFVLLACTLLTVLAALSFGHLTVQDHGDHLAIRYGPLPLFRKKIPYAAITTVEPGKTSIIDGWGIHYVPFRGWTYFYSAKLLSRMT